VRTAECRDKLALVLRLHAFGDGRDVEALRERDHRADDRQRLTAAARCGTDKAAVDLDRGKAGAAEIAQRRVANAEIIEAQAYAKVEDTREGRRRATILAQEDALGNLELEPVG
jgi:hypothetical protein